VRKFTVLVAFVFLAARSGFAADYPQAEVFGGFQYSHLQLGKELDGPGFNLAFNGNLSRYFGITADFGSSYGNLERIGISNYTYTFGPVFSLRAHRRYTPFVHVLVGGEHASASYLQFNRSINGLALIAGGGVDANINHRLALRVAQADWIWIHGNGANSGKNVRISTGLVLRF